MKTKTNTIKKSVAMLAFVAIAAAGTLGTGANIAFATVAPNWNTTGSYVVNMEYMGTQYPHDLVLVQDGLGNLTGNGGSPAAANTYTWVLTSGTVAGDAIDFLADYTATADAVTPLTTMHVMGVVAPDGTISGTWSDNYQGGVREGALSTVSGQAVLIPTPGPTITGQIGGTVTGGASAGTLSVTSIETTDSTAVADGTFANGWEYVFNITIPTNESNLAMKFFDWSQTGGAGTIATANNMRISSAQADNAGATVLVTAANVYTIPALHMIVDLDPALDGIQTKIIVEVAVPTGTINGAYTTSYGVQTN